MANEVGFDRLIKKDADISDTLHLIIDTVNKQKHSQYIKTVVHLLSEGKPDRETFIRRVFDYYCRAVEYLMDTKGVEKVYTPARTIIEGKGDCKKAATFIASVLACAGIEPVLKHVYYDKGTDFTHIYVIVPNPTVKDYITLDPTNNCQYNAEVKYKSATLYYLNGKKMDLKLMGASHNAIDAPILACANSVHDNISDVSAAILGAPTHAIPDHSAPGVHLHAALASQLAKGRPMPHAIVHALLPNNPKLAAVMVKVPISVQRQGFLDVIKYNVDGYATTLLQVMAKNPKALNNVWGIMGGDMAHLKMVLLQGAKHPVTHSDGSNPPPAAHVSGSIGWGWHSIVHGILHAAACVLHVVAPIANLIVPGSGAVLNSVANTADNVANSIPPDGAPPLPPPDPNGVNFGVGVTAGSFIGSIGGFAFKSLLMLSVLPMPHLISGILGSAVVASIPVLMYFKKK